MTRCLVPLFLCASFLHAQQTVAEKTDYRATSRHADVVAFCEELKAKSPSVRLTDIGKSGEGRTLPMLILADPPIATPEEAARSKKFVVLTFANIHAGEVDGKEAVLMLARDIATGEGEAKSLLKELIVLVVPILNADGNEKIDPKNRSEQNGPPDGVGVRANAAGYDLNRDFVKLETPEVRGLVKAISKWDPAVIVDMHTTNGSYHQYTLTYDGPRHPAADPDLIVAAREKWLPAVTAEMLKSTGYKSFAYGNFNADRTAWESYTPVPRFGIQAFAIRNRFGFLSESYTYAPFKDRVLAGKAYCGGLFKYAADHADEVRKSIAKADQPRDRIALRNKVTSLVERTVLGFVEETKDDKRTPTKEAKEYKVAWMNGVEPTLEVQRPYAYLISPKAIGVIENLQRHGIVVEETREDIELDCQVYKVTKSTQAKSTFQKHSLRTVEVERRDQSTRVAAGTILVRTEQKLGMFAAYLLEPQAEDGLTTWNFFDADLAEGADFPVIRVAKAAPITRSPIRPLTEDRTFNKPITPETMFRSPPNLSGSPVGGITWIDSENFLQVKDGKLWKVAALTGRAEQFIDPAKLTKSLSAIPTIKPDDAAKLAGGPAYRLNPPRTAVLFTHGDELYHAPLDGGPAVRLTKTPGPKEVASFSPDGRFVAFVRAGNLFTVDVATQAEPNSPRMAATKS